MLILLVKSKKAIFKESYKINLSQGWSRSHNSDLRLRGAGVGAERKNVGSTTLLYFTLPVPVGYGVPVPVPHYRYLQFSTLQKISRTYCAQNSLIRSWISY
jgi:hypothetical protein